jgi:hypothetical protein
MLFGGFLCALLIVIFWPIMVSIAVVHLNHPPSKTKAAAEKESDENLQALAELRIDTTEKKISLSPYGYHTYDSPSENIKSKTIKKIKLKLNDDYDVKTIILNFSGDLAESWTNKSRPL